MTTRRARTSSGWDVAYDIQGAGAPILLVCGVLMNRGRWHATGYVERLAQRFTVVCVDPLGHGESDKPHDPEAYVADELVDHVVSVLDAEQFESAHLWGFSRGGFIAALAGWAVPDRIDALVLGSCPMTSESGWSPALIGSLAEGDWATFWEGFPLPDSVQSYMEKSNDPVAVAAAIRGGVAPVEWRPFVPPALGYVGDGEEMVDTNRDVAQRIGLPMAVLRTGGHAETFLNSECALALVGPFL